MIFFSYLVFFFFNLYQSKLEPFRLSAEIADLKHKKKADGITICFVSFCRVFLDLEINKLQSCYYQNTA